MTKSLLFIPDISGYTQFIQTTEIEHSQHVIAELLEILINANSQELQLAEIEGDALFFYKEENNLSQELLLAQMEQMFTAFYSHLKLLEKNRICNCNACATAPNLQLKIITHTGELQFIEVKGNRKPFGNSVIEVHRLLKNSVKSDNYVLISEALKKDIEFAKDYNSKLYQFKKGSDNYDSKELYYYFSTIDVENLKISAFDKPYKVSFTTPSNILITKKFQVSATELMEQITNYKNRHNWVEGVDEIVYNENEVTRLGTEHACVINGKHLQFTTVTKEAKPNQLIYGELTTSPAIVDELYQFFIITPESSNSCTLELEIYWKVNSPIKRLIVNLLAKNKIKKANNLALDKLNKYLISL